MANRRFIFDTNTLISALLIGSSTSDAAFRLALEIGEIVTTKVIRLELADVFLRSKFDRYADIKSRVQLLALIEQQFAEWEEPIEEISICRDPKDTSFWNWLRHMAQNALLQVTKICWYFIHLDAL